MKGSRQLSISEIFKLSTTYKVHPPHVRDVRLHARDLTAQALMNDRMHIRLGAMLDYLQPTLRDDHGSAVDWNDSTGGQICFARKLVRIGPRLLRTAFA